MKLIVLDIETANYEPTSICQLGVVVLEDFKVTQKMDYLIKPYPNQFMDVFSSLHGITKDMVENSPTFDIVWEEIKDLFNEFSLCIAHNASFDFGNIKSTLKYYDYDVDSIKFPILCTMQYAQHSDVKFEKYNLGYLCDYFGIENKQAHSALSDALATSELFLKLIEANNDDLGSLIRRSYKYSFSGCSAYQQKPKKNLPPYSNVSQKNIVATNTVFDEKHILYGKTVVITGQLDSFSRAEAYLAIKNVGGLCGDSVTKKTNYLVTNSSDMTSKMRLALKYKEKGQDITIINEAQFYELLK